MKKIFSIAIALIATIGLSMSAASVRGNQDSTSKKDKTEKREGKKFNKRQGNGFNPFEGLNLTEEQQNQLKALKPSKPEKAPKEAQCCQGDSAACCQGEGQACCWQLSPQKAKEQAQERLAKIKGILTPEQYQQYLENVAVNQMLFQKQGRKNRPGKDGRPGKADKPRRPGKPAAEQQQQ